MASRGKREEAFALSGKLDPFLKGHCERLMEGIVSGSDLHYCVVAQKRAGYSEFFSFLVSKKNEIESLLKKEQRLRASDIISKKLTEILDFMQRKIDCRADINNGKITVLCKTYCVKTLIAEYEALFADKPGELSNWDFVAVDWFEKYL